MTPTIIVSLPSLDPTLVRIRKAMKIGAARWRAMYVRQAKHLLIELGLPAVHVQTRRGGPWSPPRAVGNWPDDVQVMIAECACEAASEALVRLLNLVANRLGSAGKLPTGYNRRVS